MGKNSRGVEERERETWYKRGREEKEKEKSGGERQKSEGKTKWIEVLFGGRTLAAAVVAVCEPGPTVVGLR